MAKAASQPTFSPPLRETNGVNKADYHKAGKLVDTLRGGGD